jgi:hypothetical protein
MYHFSNSFLHYHKSSSYKSKGLHIMLGYHMRSVLRGYFYNFTLLGFHFLEWLFVGLLLSKLSLKILIVICFDTLDMLVNST